MVEVVKPARYDMRSGKIIIHDKTKYHMFDGDTSYCGTRYLMEKEYKLSDVSDLDSVPLEDVCSLCLEEYIKRGGSIK